MEQLPRRLPEAQQFPELHVECLDDPVPRNRLVQNVLDFRQLVLAPACRPPHVPPDPPNRSGHNRHKDQQHPGHLPAQRNHHHDHARQRAQLLQEIRQHRRGRILHALNVVDQRRKQRARRVLLKERHRPPQDRLVEVVPHIGDHAEPGIVRQVRARVIANALQQRRRHKRKRNRRPVVVYPVRNEQFRTNIDVPPLAKLSQQRRRLRPRRRVGVQHVVEDRPDQQDPERIHQAHAGSQNHRRERLQPVTSRVIQQAPQAAHAGRTSTASDTLARFGSHLHNIRLFYPARQPPCRTGIQDFGTAHLLANRPGPKASPLAALSLPASPLAATPAILAHMTASPSLSAEERARRIQLIIFDVDGVLTDGGIWLFPAPAPSTTTADHAAAMESKGGYAISSASMVEAKGFNAHDGTGVSLARLGGMKCAIITKRISETVALRARDLRLEYVYMGQAYKMQSVRDIMAKEKITLDEICYVGDDVIDLPVMRVCGFAVAVANAREQVKASAHYVTPHEGGHGAARDAVEFILAAKGILEKIIEQYIDERNPLPASMDIGKGGF